MQYWAKKPRKNKNNEVGICYLDHNKRVDLTVIALLSWCHIEPGNNEADISKNDLIHHLSKFRTILFVTNYVLHICEHR